MLVMVKVAILVGVVSFVNLSNRLSAEYKILTCRCAKDQSTFMAGQVFQQRVLVQLQDVKEKGKREIF